MDAKGKVQDHLRKALKDDTLQLPEQFQAQLPQVKEVLRKLAGKLDIKNADERRPIKTRQAVLHSEEFQALWNRIKHKTTYRVQFDNEKLVTDCAKAIGQCPPITKTRVQIRKADLAIGRGGVLSTETTVAAPIIDRRNRHRTARPADRPSGQDPTHPAQSRAHSDRQRPPR